MVPTYEDKTVSYKVQVPYTENVEQTYTVMVPTYEDKTVSYTVQCSLHRERRADLHGEGSLHRTA